MDQPDYETPGLGPWRLLVQALVLEGGLGLLAVVLGWMVGCSPLEQLYINPEALAAGAMATLPILVLLWVSVRLPYRPFAELRHVLDELLIPIFHGSRLWHLAVIALLAGWGEELFFRGLLQEGLARWIGPPAGTAIALAVASVVFGLVHWITPTYVQLIALVGVYLGSLWILSENLLVPIVAHSVYDFFALVYLVKWRARAGT